MLRLYLLKLFLVIVLLPFGVFILLFLLLRCLLFLLLLLSSRVPSLLLFLLQSLKQTQVVGVRCTHAP